MGCFIFGLNGIRRKHNSECDDISFDEEADNADLVKGEDGSFPSFPQLAKITPGDTESGADLENPDVPIPTMTNTASSELLNVGSADFGCNTDDSTVHAANLKEDEDIHSIPLPPPASDADLVKTKTFTVIPGIQPSGSTDFGKSEEEGSLEMGKEVFSPIKFPGHNASDVNVDTCTPDMKVDTRTPEAPIVSDKRCLKTEVVLGQSPQF